MTNREIETLSIIHCILKKISKTEDEKVDYDDFMWILERSDVLHILRYNFNIIDYNILSMFADEDPSLKVLESIVDKKPIPINAKNIGKQRIFLIILVSNTM